MKKGIKLKYIIDTENNSINEKIENVLNHPEINNLKETSQSFIRNIKNIISQKDDLKYKNNIFDCGEFKKIKIEIQKNNTLLDLNTKLSALEKIITTNHSLLEIFNHSYNQFVTKKRNQQNNEALSRSQKKIIEIESAKQFYESCLIQSDTIIPTKKLVKQLIKDAPSYESLVENFLSKPNFIQANLTADFQLELLRLALKKGKTHQTGILETVSKIDFIKAFEKNNFARKLKEHIEKSELKADTDAAKSLRKIYKNILEKYGNNRKRIDVPKNIKIKKAHAKNNSKIRKKIFEENRKQRKHKGKTDWMNEIEE